MRLRFELSPTIKLNSVLCFLLPTPDQAISPSLLLQYSIVVERVQTPQTAHRTRLEAGRKEPTRLPVPGWVYRRVRRGFEVSYLSSIGIACFVPAFLRQNSIANALPAISRQGPHLSCAFRVKGFIFTRLPARHLDFTPPSSSARRLEHVIASETSRAPGGLS